MNIGSFLSVLVLRTVFVITDQVPQVHRLWEKLLVLLITAILFVAARRISNLRVRRSAFVALGIAFVVTFWIVLTFAAASLPFAFNAPRFESAMGQYQSGDYTTAEGVISGYQVNSDRTGSCFLVDKTKVCTNMSSGPVGYHRNGAAFAIENGMRVKVYYRDSVILRVDLLE